MQTKHLVTDRAITKTGESAPSFMRKTLHRVALPATALFFLAGCSNAYDPTKSNRMTEQAYATACEIAPFTLAEPNDVALAKQHFTQASNHIFHGNLDQAFQQTELATEKDPRLKIELYRSIRGKLNGWIRNLNIEPTDETNNHKQQRLETLNQKVQLRDAVEKELQRIDPGFKEYLKEEEAQAGLGALLFFEVFLAGGLLFAAMIKLSDPLFWSNRKERKEKRAEHIAKRFEEFEKQHGLDRRIDGKPLFAQTLLWTLHGIIARKPVWAEKVLLTPGTSDTLQKVQLRAARKFGKQGDEIDMVKLLQAAKGKEIAYSDPVQDAIVLKMVKKFHKKEPVVNCGFFSYYDTTYPSRVAAAAMVSGRITGQKTQEALASLVKSADEITRVAASVILTETAFQILVKNMCDRIEEVLGRKQTTDVLLALGGERNASLEKAQIILDLQAMANSDSTQLRKFAKAVLRNYIDLPEEQPEPKTMLTEGEVPFTVEILDAPLGDRDEPIDVEATVVGYVPAELTKAEKKKLDRKVDELWSRIKLMRLDLSSEIDSNSKTWAKDAITRCFSGMTETEAEYLKGKVNERIAKSNGSMTHFMAGMLKAMNDDLVEAANHFEQARTYQEAWEALLKAASKDAKVADQLIERAYQNLMEQVEQMQEFELGANAHAEIERFSAMCTVINPQKYAALFARARASTRSYMAGLG